MKLILHPGQPKCGSTTIQRAILRNRNKLEQQGIYFPDQQFRFSFEENCNLKADTSRLYYKKIHNAADSQLAEELISFDKRVEEALHKAGKVGCHTVLISAENLINKVMQPSGDGIHEIFKKHFSEIRVIYFVRRQDDFILSAWQQWNHKIGESIEQHINKSLKNNTPNYLGILNYFASKYELENLAVLPLNSNLYKNNNLFEEFALQAGIDISHLHLTNKKDNETLNPFLCEVLSRHPDIYESIHDPKVKNNLLTATNNSPALLDKARLFLSYSERNQIMKHFERSNRKVHEKFMKEFDYADIWGESLISNVVNDKYEVEQLKSLVSALALSILKENSNKNA